MHKNLFYLIKIHIIMRWLLLTAISLCLPTFSKLHLYTYKAIGDQTAKDDYLQKLKRVFMYKITYSCTLLYIELWKINS